MRINVLSMSNRAALGMRCLSPNDRRKSSAGFQIGMARRMVDVGAQNSEFALLLKRHADGNTRARVGDGQIGARHLNAAGGRHGAFEIRPAGPICSAPVRAGAVALVLDGARLGLQVTPNL